MVLLIIMRTIDMKIVEFVRHDMEAGETTVYKIKLEAPLSKIAKKFLDDDVGFIPVDVYKAKKHPEDQYNKKIGRSIALSKEPKSELFEIAYAVIFSNGTIQLKLLNKFGRLLLKVNMDSEKVIVWM